MKGILEDFFPTGLICGIFRILIKRWKQKQLFLIMRLQVEDGKNSPCIQAEVTTVDQAKCPPASPVLHKQHKG